jgi:putative membrane-bound dehydrogenase-like protein
MSNRSRAEIAAGLWLLLPALAVAQTPPDPDPAPRSPRESMAQIHVREGFEVELVAAEPLVVDPVAIDWGTDGSLWVVEMADYPSGLDESGTPGGRVRRLEDTDGDGQYDRSTLFLDGIPFPTGILTWGAGILVTAAPEILYAEDTDGDGRADIKQALYSGFLEGNQQLRVNGLRWGLDNWVYCASGSHHAGYGKESQILSYMTNQSTHIGSRDFRIRPNEGLIDPQSGPSQYGRNRDAWGNWFGVQNSHPLWHYVLADHDIRRNPFFAAPDPRHQVVTPANPPVYPAKSPQKRFHSFQQSGRFTSACAAMIYRDELLFERGKALHAFTCEPFHNLVQHNLVIEEGVSFRAQRDLADGNTDFFASADRWCRPVMARTGPDGALWIVDMYRYMIEHPQWLPQDGQDELRPHYRAGDDRGRIYRIVSRASRPRKLPRLDEMSGVELVGLLQSPNAWQRDKAQQQLVSATGPGTRGDQPRASSAPSVDVVRSLERLARSSPSAFARLHALCTMDGLGALDATTLAAALKDQHAGVRRQAVRLAAKGEVDIRRLAPLAGDSDAKVRLQLASALGDCTDPRAGEVLVDLAAQCENDPYVTAALLSSLHSKNISAVLAAVFEGERIRPDSNAFAKELFSQIAAFADTSTITDAIQIVCAADNAWAMTALADLLDGLEKRDWQLHERFDDEIRGQVEDSYDRARQIALDVAQVDGSRAAAVRLLLRQSDHFNSDLEFLAGLLIPQTPPTVQQAAVSHLALRREKEVAQALLAGWRSHSPVIRGQIMSVVTSRNPWIEVLVEALESKAVLPSQFDSGTTRRLLATQDPSMLRRIEAILATGSISDRGEVVDSLQSVLGLVGDSTRGQPIYAKKCAVCHRHGDEGHEVGPNLVSLTNRSPESLLVSILDPSAAVEAKYLDYLVIRTDGRSATGMLATETGSSITLLAAEGKRVAILRNEIEAMRSTGKSLMPDGLEKELSPQDLADLIEFVRGIH